MNVIRQGCAAIAVALTAAQGSAQAQTFYELESVTTIEPAAEYLKLALTTQTICNAARQQKGLPPQAPPTVPTPYVHERLWTVANGRDFVLRRRTYALAPMTRDEMDCRWSITWSEQTAIERGGRTTNVLRTSDGVAEIERNAFTSPWSLAPVESHPRRTRVLGLDLRCATPEDLRQTDVLRPMAGVSEICIPEPPVFRDEYGGNLVVQSTTDASLFGGRGGAFRALQRVTRHGVYNVTDRTWNPQTYLSD